MRVLQELIPNCPKGDKASVLDKAIEYLKILQLQLQIMSLATRMHMGTTIHSPMQNAKLTTLADCSALGHFPNSPFVVGPSALTSVDGCRLQVLGLSGQLPLMQVSHSPFISLPTGPASLMEFMASYHPSTVKTSAANRDERENQREGIQ